MHTCVHGGCPDCQVCPDSCQVGERRARCPAEELAPKAMCVIPCIDRQTTPTRRALLPLRGQGGGEGQGPWAGEAVLDLEAMVAQHRDHAECQWLVPLDVVRLADCTLYVSECSREYNEGTGTVLDPRRPRRQAGRVPGSGVEWRLGRQPLASRQRPLTWSPDALGCPQMPLGGVPGG